jgi:lipopolysaccharide/colanic/teichoic acid biosynthesis glycosyltransferase
MKNHEHHGIPRWKRLLDIGIVVLAMPLVLPLSALVVIMIRATSRGPFLFHQERVGYHGRRFMCLKFRTMYDGAGTFVHHDHLKQLMDTDAPMVKLDASGDSRIIPVGRLLRASGLDELPQLINVLKGEMSLVGPRPCLPYEADEYLPWQQARFDVAPGLTGLWQVSGKNRTTFTRMMRLDIEYTQRRSPWLDLKIIFKTVPVVIVQMHEVYQRKKSQSPFVLPKAAVLNAGNKYEASTLPPSASF